MGGIDWKNKKAGITILSIVLVMAVAAGIWWAITLRTSVKTDNAKVVGDLSDVSSRVSGRITNIYIEEGQQVEVGQLLIKLDDSQFKINLAQALAALHIAQANYDKLPDEVKAAAAGVQKAAAGLAANQASLKSAQVALKDAQRQLEESKQLFNSGAISHEAFKTIESNYTKAQSAYEVATANVDSGQASLESAQIAVDSLNNSAAAVYLAQLEQAQAVFDNAKLAQDNTSIHAEIAGNVLRIPVSIGEYASVAQTLVTLSDLNNTWITANVDENKINRIKVGQSVDVKIDAYPGKAFKASVSEVGSVSQATFALLPSESTSGSFTKVAQRIPIKIKVNNSDVLLKPGMSATVKIYTK